MMHSLAVLLVGLSACSSGPDFACYKPLGHPPETLLCQCEERRFAADDAKPDRPIEVPQCNATATPALGGSTFCCASPGYPTEITSTCECKSAQCWSDSLECSCSAYVPPTSTSPASACDPFPGGGVCCATVDNTSCRCFAPSLGTSCATDEIAVASCSARAITCKAGSVTTADCAPGGS